MDFSRIHFKRSTLEDVESQPDEWKYLIFYDDDAYYSDIYRSLPRYADYHAHYLNHYPPSVYAAPEVLRDWMDGYIGGYECLHHRLRRFGWLDEATQQLEEGEVAAAPVTIALVDLCRHTADGNTVKQALLAVFLRAYKGDLVKAWAEMVRVLGSEADTWDDVSLIYKSWVVGALQRITAIASSVSDLEYKSQDEDEAAQNSSKD